MGNEAMLNKVWQLFDPSGKGKLDPLDNILLAKFDALRRYAAWLGIRVDDLKGDRALLRRRVLRHLSREHTLK